MEQYFVTVKRNDKIGGIIDIPKFIVGPTIKEGANKIEDKEINVNVLDHLKSTNQDKIKNNEKITATKPFGDSKVKVIVALSSFILGQSTSSTSGSSTNDTQRTSSSSIAKPKERKRDAIRKYSRKTKTPSYITHPPMNLTAPKLIGDRKVTVIVASSTPNSGEIISNSRDNKGYKEDKEDNWLEKNEKKTSNSSGNDIKNNIKEERPTLNQKFNYIFDHANKKNNTPNTTQCPQSIFQGPIFMKFTLQQKSIIDLMYSILIL